MPEMKKHVWGPAARLYGLSLIVELLVEVFSRRSLISALSFLAVNPLAFLYNALVIMTPFILAWFFRRRNFVIGLIAAFWLILGIVNGVVLSFRVTPFCPTDVLLIKDAIRICGNYLRWYYFVLFAVLVVALVVSIRMMWKKLPPIPGTVIHKGRTLILLCAMVFCVLITNEVGRMTGFLASNFANIAEAYRTYGFVCCFTYGIFDTGISKPQDYNAEEVDEIVEENTVPEEEQDSSADETVTADETAVAETESGDTETAAGGTAETPNIIYVQLESLFDITTMDTLTFNQDPLPNLHKLAEEYTSGWLSVPCIGAGTANTEFETITGMNLDFFGPGEYPYKTVLKSTTCESMCYDMSYYGYSSHAIHDNTGTFYSRNTVFPQLGFDTFTSSEYMEDLTYNENGYVKDEVLVQQILDAIDSTEGPDLIYTISVQGHGSYPTEDILQQKDITVEGLEDEGETNQFTYYANQIYQMDQFVGQLTQALEESGEQCVLVLYGDHLPSLDIPEETLGGNTLFQTPLVIWDTLGLEKEELDIQAYQLNAYVENRLGFHHGVVTQYHQTWFDSEDVINPDSVSEDDEDYEVYEDYLTNLETIEYDMLYGDRESTGGENPYIATDMEMGVKEISMNNVSYRDGSLYVSGENFTAASKVMVNDKVLDTQNLSDTLLGVPDFEPEEEMTICVVQYAEKDKEVLSSTPVYELKLRTSVILGEEQAEE